MAITIVSAGGQGSATASVDVTLTGTQGNLQVLIVGHRASSQTLSVPGGGWSVPRYVESYIANTSWRRGIAVAARTVPAAAGATVTATWSSLGPCAAVGFEFTGNESGTWSLFGGSNDADTGDTATATSLLDGGVTRVGTQTLATSGIVFRHGDTGAEAGATNLDVSDDYGASGTGVNEVSLAGGYDIGTGGEQGNWAWTTSAAATAAIDWFEFTPSGGADAAPQAPTGQTATAGDSQVVITWTDETVGIPNPTYTIERGVV